MKELIIAALGAGALFWYGKGRARARKAASLGAGQARAEVFSVNEGASPDVPYRVEYRPANGRCAWSVYGPNELILIGAKSQWGTRRPNAAPLKSGDAGTCPQALHDAKAWARADLAGRHDQVPYQADTEFFLPNPAEGHMVTVTYDKLLPWRVEGQGTDGLELIDSKLGAFTFKVTRPLVPGEVRDAYVIVYAEEDSPLGNFRVSAQR